MDTKDKDNKITNIKTLIKVMFIYRALENGWTVTKSKKIKNAFEFTTPTVTARTRGLFESAKNKFQETERRRSISYPIKFYI